MAEQNRKPKVKEIPIPGLRGRIFRDDRGRYWIKLHGDPDYRPMTTLQAIKHFLKWLRRPPANPSREKFKKLVEAMVKRAKLEERDKNQKT